MNESSAAPDDRRTAPALIRWFLLTGNRLLVSLVVLLGIGIPFVVAGLFGLVTVTAPTRMMWYLNGTVNGLLTLVPIAVGVNQIILSHEFGSIRELYERRSDVTEFRERVGQQMGTTLSSPRTSTFFRSLLESVSKTASVLDGAQPRSRGGLTAEIATVARSIGDRADATMSRLDAGDPSTFETLVVMLDYDNSQHFDEVRRLRNEAPKHADTTEDLQQIEEYFMEIDAARQYLKTVVVERQLARLSRLLIYTGIPAVSVAVFGIFTYRNIAGTMVPHTLLVVAAGTLIVATLVPLVILGAYILRVATIARRTAMFGPFVPESSG